MGSGIGSIPRDRFVRAIDELLHATVPGGFQIAAKAVPLSGVEQAWRNDDGSPAHCVHRGGLGVRRLTLTAVAFVSIAR